VEDVRVNIYLTILVLECILILNKSLVVPFDNNFKDQFDNLLYVVYVIESIVVT